MPDTLDRLKSALADRYTIERELGAGGMATVYLAEDVKHHRKIAVKVLRPELAAALGPERFLREIEIAANLTHPHILPLYDSGQADGFLFYVMPYVEGESLRERLNSEKQLPLEDALRIAREVADALSYAHGHDVVHRDIKPENILLEERHAVVADFGIARAITAAGGEKLTETGIAIGTVSYMSPEQASGEHQLDGRSDIYSLGCVLYEMLAGEPPFTGPSSQAVIARKLSDQIPSLRTVRETVPVSIETAIEKALAKVPADRFSTADQFAEALTISDSPGMPTVGAPAEDSAGMKTTQTEPSARRRFGPALVASAAVLVLVGVFGTRMLRPRPFTITTSNIRQVTRDPGLEIDPVLSPDGNEVAYVAGPPFQTQLLVRSVVNVRGGTSSPADGLAGYQRLPSWSPDGQLVRFESCSIPLCQWREVGKLGGSLGTISTPENGIGFSWSRSGALVAYPVADSVFVASADGARSELLTVAPAPGQPHSFAWSPDGETVAFVNGNIRWLGNSTLGNVAVSSIWVVSVAGGDPILVTDRTSNNQSPAWLPDAKHLLFISDRDGSRAAYVVEVDRAGSVGDPQPITGVSDPHSISVSVDGRRLLYSKFSLSRNIRSLPIRRSGAVGISEGHPLTSGQQIIESLDLSPAGDSIAYDSNLEGNQDIYKMSLEGGDPVALTDDPADDYYPDWSPDGTQIAFYSLRTGSREIWVMSADGTNEQQLTDMPSSENYFPNWSADGLKIAFASCPPGGCEVWVVSRDSVGGNWGEPEQLTVSGGEESIWTPDGSIIFYQRGGLGLVSSSEEERSIPTPFFQRSEMPRLSVDGSTIYALAIHRDRGVREVWTVPQNGSEPRLVVESDDPSLNILNSGWAVGTDNIYLSLAEYESDIWVVDLEW